MRFNVACVLAAAGLGLAAGSTADASLVITEIWAGGLAGAEATSDWFELTNLGLSTVTGIDSYYYDDDSADPTVNDPLSGISSIDPGESVIFLTDWEDDFGTQANATAAFISMWGAGNLAGIQIGFVNGGAGLGNSGDVVNIFDGNTPGANLVASQAYLFGNIEESWVWNPISESWNDEIAQAGVFGAFESLLPASSGEGVGLAVGSPGLIAPGPGSLALLAVAGMVGPRRRRLC